MAEVTSGNVTVIVLDDIEATALCEVLSRFPASDDEGMDSLRRLYELCDALGVEPERKREVALVRNAVNNLYRASK